LQFQAAGFRSILYSAHLFRLRCIRQQQDDRTNKKIVTIANKLLEFGEDVREPISSRPSDTQSSISTSSKPFCVKPFVNQHGYRYHIMIRNHFLVFDVSCYDAKKAHARIASENSSLCYSIMRRKELVTITRMD